MPLSISILRVDPGRVGLFYERIPILGRAAGKETEMSEGREVGWKTNQHTRSSGRAR